MSYCTFLFSINIKTSVELHDVEVVIIRSVSPLIAHSCLYKV